MDEQEEKTGAREAESAPVEEAPAAAPVVEIGAVGEARSALDQALVENEAMRQVLARHNIRVNTDGLDLSALRVENGRVIGEVPYSPPGVRNRLQQGEGAYRQRPPAPDAQAASPVAEPLTLDAVAKWSAAEVNSRWDEVQHLLKQ